MAKDPTGADSRFSSATMRRCTTLFQKQVREVLEQSDLDEDAKQAILVAMNCPCCGAGAMNYTAQINRKKKPGRCLRR